MDLKLSRNLAPNLVLGDDCIEINLAKVALQDTVNI